MPVDSAFSWDADWAWALPLSVFTVIFHSIALTIINRRVIQPLSPPGVRSNVRFALVMGASTLLATGVLALEAGLWAASYEALGALPDSRTAMLYSLSAITTYGHTELHLAAHWRLMGALEALNGVLLLGLTTAFLYGQLQRSWPEASARP